MEQSTGKNTFNDYTACIAYAPLADEVDPFACSWIRDHSWTVIETVPPHTGLDPFSHATWVCNRLKNESICILVPGRLFDRLGSRKGRGGGWYDRFLSAVPRSWLRVGVCDTAQLTDAPLEKKPHDESMDMLMVRTGSAWKLLTVRH